MKHFSLLLRQLEYRMACPSYSGTLLLGISLFFFIAATNTLAGWLYVMSGFILALMGISIFLARQMLRGIRLDRPPIEPVQAGERLRIRLSLYNQTAQPKSLLQVVDVLPSGLGGNHSEVVPSLPARSAIDRRSLAVNTVDLNAASQNAASQNVASQNAVDLNYEVLAPQRGVYRWMFTELRTGAPLGLVWASRSLRSPNCQAIVHPRILPLSHCPLIDQLGRDPSLQQLNNRTAQAASSGQTRSLRPYRWGDSTRLIHWRTSARTGELRVRELETFTSGQRLVIALDSARSWQPDAFEQAVSAAATLYFYAVKQQLQVQLWTASTGIVTGDRPVLDSLAATNPNELRQAEELPDSPILWLTCGGDRVLPLGSRTLCWNGTIATDDKMMVINPNEPLELQLSRLGL